jgi:hypothetical protein
MFKITGFTPFELFDRYQRVGGSCYLHLYLRRMSCLSTKIQGVISRNLNIGCFDKLQCFMDEKSAVLSSSPYSSFSLFRRVRKTIAESDRQLRHASVCLSVHPFIRMEQTDSHRTDFRKISSLLFVYTSICRHMPIWVKIEKKKTTDTLHQGSTSQIWESPPNYRR